MVTMPQVPPCSSTTTATWVLAFWSWVRSWRMGSLSRVKITGVRSSERGFSVMPWPM